MSEKRSSKLASSCEGIDIDPLIRHTAPGGYFELQELDHRFRSDDGSLEEDSNLASWSQIITDAAVTYNRPIPLYNEYLKLFKMAGFEDVREVFIKSPSNPWPKDPKLKDVGRYQLLCHMDGFEGVSLGLLCRGASWKAEEVSVLAAKMRPEVRDRSIHSYQTKYVS